MVIGKWYGKISKVLKIFDVKRKW